mgnify:CR=1 FL=1
MESKHSSKRKYLDSLSDKIDLISSFLMLILVSVVLIEVAARYFFNSPFTFTYDLTSLLVPWIVFLSLISVTYHKEHIGIVLFISKLSLKSKKVVAIINEFLTMFFILFMFIGAIQLSIAVSNQMIGNLYMSKTFYYLSLVISLAFILFLKINEIIAILKGEADLRTSIPSSEVEQIEEIRNKNSINILKKGDDKR